MPNDISDYARLCELCDDELEAAREAESDEARIGHLEQAFRFANRASRTKGGTLGSERKL